MAHTRRKGIVCQSVNVPKGYLRRFLVLKVVQATALHNWISKQKERDHNYYKWSTIPENSQVLDNLSLMIQQSKEKGINP